RGTRGYSDPALVGRPGPALPRRRRLRRRARPGSARWGRHRAGCAVSRRGGRRPPDVASRRGDPMTTHGYLSLTPPLALAVMEGRKTQTMRPMTPQVPDVSRWQHWTDRDWYTWSPLGIHV